jgi:hypothetical protein
VLLCGGQDLPMHPGEFYLLLSRGVPNPALVVGLGAASRAIRGRCCIATTPLYRRKGIPLTVGTDITLLNS